MALDFSRFQYLCERGRRIYFVGIGGISMGGLAKLALAHGQIVGGSDMASNSRLEALRQEGASIFSPQKAENIDAFRPDALVFTAAIPPDAPELLRGRELGLPTLERSDWLGLVNRQHRDVVNVAGTNGKSTTTAMLAAICLDAGLDPTVHLGAEFDRFGGTVRAGSSSLMISEACEFHRSFLSFYSSLAAVLNLGHDHVDCFPTMDDVVEVFAEFLAGLAPGSRAVLPSFDPFIPELLKRWKALSPLSFSESKRYYFGYPSDPCPEPEAPRLIAKSLDYKAGFPVLKLEFEGRELGSLELSVPGKFNAENALAALLMALLLGVDSQTAMTSLASFTGVEGRFTLCGRFHGASIVNDYAHHPDSVAKTLEAAHSFPLNRLYACFQPITYSRAEGLFEGYVEALKQEDPAILLEVFDDREKDHHFSSRRIAEAINARGGHALFFAEKAELECYLREHLGPDDMALLMGQDIRGLGDRLAQRSDHYHGRLSLKEDFPEKEF